MAPEVIFSEYAYFASFSDSWLEHARRYAEAMRGALDLGPDSLVVEVGSNDGYLLRRFVEMGVPVLGIDPAANVARAAEAVGVPTMARSSIASWPSSCVGADARRTSSSATTCWPRSPTSTASWPGWPPSWGPRGP